MKIVVSAIISLLVVFVSNEVYKYIEVKSKEKSFVYICDLVVPRLQLGAFREVQELLISSFSEAIRKEEILPVLWQDQSALIGLKFASDRIFECKFESIPNIKIIYYFNQKSISAPVKVIIFLSIALAFCAFFFFIEKRQMRKAQLAFDKRFSEISRQVAHDIRSPVMALEAALKNCEGISYERKELIEGASRRISSIAEDLLARSRIGEIASKATSDNQTFDLRKPRLNRVDSTIRNIVEEKKSQYSNLKIELNGIDDEITISCEPVYFERMLANILQNAIEAVADVKEAKVEVAVRKYSDKVQISVVDNGIGIPENILPRIGENGFSFRKEKGNGLGVSLAKRKVLEWGGEFAISSKVDVGTIVTLVFYNQ